MLNLLIGLVPQSLCVVVNTLILLDKYKKGPQPTLVWTCLAVNEFVQFLGIVGIVICMVDPQSFLGSVLVHWSANSVNLLGLFLFLFNIRVLDVFYQIPAQAFGLKRSTLSVFKFCGIAMFAVDLAAMTLFTTLFSIQSPYYADFAKVCPLISSLTTAFYLLYDNIQTFGLAHLIMSFKVDECHRETSARALRKYRQISYFLILGTCTDWIGLAFYLYLSLSGPPVDLESGLLVLVASLSGFHCHVLLISSNLLGSLLLTGYTDAAQSVPKEVSLAAQSVQSPSHLNLPHIVRHSVNESRSSIQS
ncbi:hypothetical protein HDU91_006510 [Kappamyces sp. JEL0680]|nr:hypothetical protein HDU91_006510 [Kappamyces sp. JEL0680]